MFQRHLVRTLAGLFFFSLFFSGSALAAPRTRAKAQPAAATATAKVNINTASEEQLQYLPGVGPSKARKIVRYRKLKKFRGTSQIVRVKGIGRKTYRKLRPFLAVDGPTTATAKIKLPQDE